MFVAIAELEFSKANMANRATLDFDVMVRVAVRALRTTLIGGGEINVRFGLAVAITAPKRALNGATPIHGPEFIGMQFAATRRQRGNGRFDLLARSAVWVEWNLDDVCVVGVFHLLK
jgi:hypothetical protein